MIRGARGRVRSALGLAACLAAAACAGTEDSSPAAGTDEAGLGSPDADAAPEGPTELWADLDGDGVPELMGPDVEDRRVQVDPPGPGQFTVQIPAVLIPAGADMLTCIYGTWEGPDQGIVDNHHFSDPKTNHHFIVNDLPPDVVINVPPNTPTRCTESVAHPEGASLFNWIPGARDKGIGSPLRHGQRYYAELHNLNTSDHPVLTSAAMTFDLVPLGELNGYTQSYSFGPANIDIPPHSTYHVQAACTWPQDTSVIVVRPHMHAMGVRYALDYTSAKGTERLMEIDPWLDDYFMAEQPSMFFGIGEFPVKKGDVFTTHCTWENTTGAPVKTPTEMCNTFGVAYPLDGPLNENCAFTVVPE